LVNKLPMGTTTLSAIEVAALVHAMEEEYTVEKYHIITRNCNHFSDVLLQKICSGRCPADIMSLAAEVMATPFGAMVKPLFESMFVGKRKTVDQVEMREQIGEMNMTKEQGDVVFDAIHSALDQ